MNTMASRGLKKKPVLEDLIGEGVNVRAPQRPYTQLGDDPRVLAYNTLGQDPSMWRELEWKLHAARLLGRSRSFLLSQHAVGSPINQQLDFLTARRVLSATVPPPRPPPART